MKSSNYLRQAKRRGHKSETDSQSAWMDKIIGKNHLCSLLNVNRAQLDHWIKSGMPVLKHGGINKEWEFDLIAVKSWLKSQNLWQE